jgi:hypothetical protein
MVGFPSGQREQTVTLLLNYFGGSNPPPTTLYLRGNSSVGRASAFQAGRRGFEPRFPLKCSELIAHVAQEVEHLLGKEEVTGSSPVVGSIYMKKDLFKGFKIGGI